MAWFLVKTEMDIKKPPVVPAVFGRFGTLFFRYVQISLPPQALENQK